MDKFMIQKKLNEISENFRRDIFIFDSDSNRPATEADLHRLASMNYYAISGITELLKELID